MQAIQDLIQQEQALRKQVTALEAEYDAKESRITQEAEAQLKQMTQELAKPDAVIEEKVNAEKKEATEEIEKTYAPLFSKAQNPNEAQLKKAAELILKSFNSYVS